ncbi:COG4705 family protein [Aurantiacibacter spongiae]|uniref:Membrane-anchored protein n=1 Tax=Aurantiacibacter spongiae TaxID=2488860 RepID=A0A3N5CVV0_9SPHN|nr:hypothetical protein [Aurantiacibacter spongiae]RPF71620.1 hypothetical protein EG799_08295 [Aurantiacibacter spongiae]
MTRDEREMLAKVPAVTLGFWIVKILATTFGETMGDTVSMSWLGETSATAGQSGVNGYVVGTAIFGAIFALFTFQQVRASRFHPALYWATIIASTTVGTTLADFATRSLGIGYPGGSALLFALVLMSLFVWHRSIGTISAASVHRRDAELFYWLTITFSQTLGTALGDWVADGPLGYLGAAEIFGGALIALAVAYRFTKANRVALFWSAFILTRPLGAVVGDFLDKPVASGGLELSRLAASIVLALAIVVLVIVLPQRPETVRAQEHLE